MKRKNPMTTTESKTTPTQRRVEQKEFLRAAIEWLECYPSTQQDMEVNYRESEDADYAEKLAAYLSVQIQEMPNEA
jgi:hypothetical protein